MPSPEPPLLDFSDAAGFEQWLAQQPEGAAGAWVRFPKGEARAHSLGKSEAIDCALAHGWIDGQLGRIDASAYKIRFTPRRPRGAWSQNNRARAESLIAAGRMTARGLAEVERAKADGRWAAAYPSARDAAPDADLLAALDARPEARRFFDSLDGANRYAVLYRVHQAKERRTEKIAEIVERLASGLTYHPPRKPRSR